MIEGEGEVRKRGGESNTKIKGGGAQLLFYESTEEEGRGGGGSSRPLA